jgi:hypothetical protein
MRRGLRTWRGLLALAPAVLALAWTPSALAAPAQVPCGYVGGGHYNCQFYPAGDGISGGAPVQASDGSRIGYLNHGTNWVLCQHTGSKVGTSSVYNIWWAYTEANDGTFGWVNAYYAQGGDNDGSFQGVPGCDSSHGYPPGGAPPPPPRTPAPVPCSSIGGGKHDCTFYPAGDGISGGTVVFDANGNRVGYLNYGTNWVLCQNSGIEVSVGSDHNKWWAYTESDNGKFGWVNAVYGAGGANDGEFQGVPGCGSAHGAPPTHLSSNPPPSGGGGGGSPHGGVCSSTPGHGDNVSRWTPVVVCDLKLLGQDSSQNISDMLLIIQHESSGDPTAVNTTDINAQEGHPSQGLTQVIPSNFQEYGDSSLSSNILDAAANIYAGANYAIHRYGAIHNAKGLVDLRNTGVYTWYALKGIRHPLRCGTVKAGGGERLTLTARAITCRQARGAAKTLAGARAVRTHLKHVTPGTVTRGFRIKVKRTKLTCRGVRLSTRGTRRHGPSQYVLSCTSRAIRLQYGAEPNHRGGRQP